MTDLRKAAEMALDAMLSEYSTGGENKYSPWDVIEALRQALAQPEQPMSPEHLPRYVATNGVKPMEGGGGGGSQPEPDWTTDTPIPPFKYLDLPEYKTTQPEQEPVAVIGNWGSVEWAEGVFPQIGDKMYAAPPKQWVGLTDEELVNMVGESVDKAGGWFRYHSFSRAIEAKLKEKNT